MSMLVVQLHSFPLLVDDDFDKQRKQSYKKKPIHKQKDQW